MAETVEPVLTRSARHGSLRRQVLGLFVATVLVLLVFGLGARAREREVDAGAARVFALLEPVGVDRVGVGVLGGDGDGGLECRLARGRPVHGAEFEALRIEEVLGAEQGAVGGVRARERLGLKFPEGAETVVIKP